MKWLMAGGVFASLTSAFFAAMLLGNTANAAQGECRTAIAVLSANDYSISSDTLGRTRKKLGPEYFGFNLVWTGFQGSHWLPAFRKVAPEIVEWMTVFPGAVYRYGSNVTDWRDAVGQPLARPARKIESWANPIVANFGYDEYLQFVTQVNGRAWVIANIFGVYEGELSTEWLAANAADWLRYSELKKQNGMPAILRWELGNELDRGKANWSPDKYTGNAGAVGNVLLQSSNKPTLVAMLEDYDAFKGMSASQYNRKVVQMLSPQVREFAQHLYYDGSPGGPPIPNRLAHLCQSIEDVYSVRPDIKPVFWITEHARNPPGDDKPDWQKNWWRSVNLEGALGVADMMIAATQVPEVQGLFLHSMEGAASPWPLFHRMSDGRLQPSAVYYALSILRKSMLDEVLQTQTSSRWDSGYPGRYDIRATVLSNSARDKYAIWAVNRNNASITTKVYIPALSSKHLTVQVSVLADPDLDAGNSLAWSRLRPRYFEMALSFDKTGLAVLNLPANSVSAISMDVPK